MSTASYAYPSSAFDWDEEAWATADLMAFTKDPVPKPVAELVGTEHTPSWFPDLVAELNDVLDLPDGWAGEGSKAPTSDVALDALRVLHDLSAAPLPPPQLVPTVDGGIQFEWHTRGIDLELCVLPSGERDAYVFDWTREVESAGTISTLFEDIRLAIRALID